MSTAALFASFFFRQPAVVATFLIAWALFTGVLLVLRRWTPSGPGRIAVTVAAAGALSLTVAFTWLPGSGDHAELLQTPSSLNRVQQELLDPHAAIGAWAYDTDGPLNVLLYLPAGFTLALLALRIRDCWKVLLAPAVLSLGTEIWQALTATPSGSLSDVSTNTIGAILGATTAIALRIALGAIRRNATTPPPARDDATGAMTGCIRHH